MKKRILVLFVDNSSGVLTRVCLLFSQRGFNILSITCSATCYPNIARMTIVTEGDESQISQIIKYYWKRFIIIKNSRRRF